MDSTTASGPTRRWDSGHRRPSTIPRRGHTRAAFPRWNTPATSRSGGSAATVGVRWNSKWVCVSHVLGDEYVGFEAVDDGLCEVFYGPVRLGRFHERISKIEDDRGRKYRRCVTYVSGLKCYLSVRPFTVLLGEAAQLDVSGEYSVLSHWSLTLSNSTSYRRTAFSGKSGFSFFS